MARRRMEDVNDPQLYSSTAHLLPNEDRALAAQLAHSMGLVADWQLVRYHPRIGLAMTACVFMVLLQVGLVSTGFFLPRLVPSQWLMFSLIEAVALVFLLVFLIYALHNRFLVALKTRGYLLMLRPFKCLRRIPMVIGCFYAVGNLLLLGLIQFECPQALREPVNRTCEHSSWFLQEPYWLFYYVSVVGQGALLAVAYIGLGMRLVRFHLQASRGRLLPDVLAELAELGAPAGRPVTEAALAGQGGVPTEIPINASNEVREVHSRIVDMIDQPGSSESLSRVVMERQADLLFYMHQRIECLQEELARVYHEQQAA